MSDEDKFNGPDEQDDGVNEQDNGKWKYVQFRIPKHMLPISGVAVISCVDEEYNFSLQLSDFGEMKITEALGSLQAAADIKKAMLLGSAHFVDEEGNPE